jgi:hypothetical protein
MYNCKTCNVIWFNVYLYLHLQQALLDNEKRRRQETAAYGHNEMPMVNNKKDKKVVQVIRAIFVYFDFFLEIYVDCKCRLQCVNNILSSQYFTFKYIFKMFMKITMNLMACCFKRSFLYKQTKWSLRQGHFWPPGTWFIILLYLSSRWFGMWNI